MIKASEALKPKARALPARKGPPIKASKLQQERYAKACADLERAIGQRERAFGQLVRAHQKTWKLARVVHRYEKKLV